MTLEFPSVTKLENNPKFFKFYSKGQGKNNSYTYSSKNKKSNLISGFLIDYRWIILILILGFLLFIFVLITFGGFQSRFPVAFEKESKKALEEAIKVTPYSDSSLMNTWINIYLVKAKLIINKLTTELTFSIIFGFSISWIFGVVIGEASGLYFGLVYGSIFGIVLGVFSGLLGGAIIGYAGILGGDPEGGLYFGVVWGFCITFGWLSGYFRLIPFYPYYLFRDILHSYNLDKNPYKKNSGIWFPIIGLKSKLIEETVFEPLKANEFVNFLIQHRPLQEKLAMHLTHAANAGSWIIQDFKPEALRIIPLIPEKMRNFQPSIYWFQTLTSVREELLAYLQQNNIGFKLKYFESYFNQLQEFKEITLRKESALWNHYYLRAFDKWIKLVSEEYETLKTQARLIEPVTRNVYRSGNPLNPEIDSSIFMGRQDVIYELQQKILSSSEMPMFLIHGQRRVGKTSLLKFLPRILGPRFKLVYIDVQFFTSIQELIQALILEFDKVIESENIYPKHQFQQIARNEWTYLWKYAQQHFEEMSKNIHCKIIIAFDEYEKIHELFQENLIEAGHMLDAMRSFSQHQNNIVFLLVGATFFSQLSKPSWSKYFVQAVLLEVDYLSHDQTIQLVNVAALDYPKAVSERIYQLTNGHPALVQRICQELVTIANKENRKNMTMNDLEIVLKKAIYRMQNGVVEVFWGQFCHSQSLKNTVNRILDNCLLLEDKPSLVILKEHGFIIERNGKIRLRVPIFEEWLKTFKDTINLSTK